MWIEKAAGVEFILESNTQSRPLTEIRKLLQLISDEEKQSANRQPERVGVGLCLYAMHACVL